METLTIEPDARRVGASLAQADIILSAEGTSQGLTPCTLCRSCPWHPEAGTDGCACQHIAKTQALAQSTAGAMAMPQGMTHSRTERIDAIIAHRHWGLALFLGVMYVVFNLVQKVSAPFLGWIDDVISGPITHWLLALLAIGHAPAWLESLVVDGVVAGVGGVLVFVPGLLVMYLCLGLLEESGYMPRAALVMDRVMQTIGLRGRSFLPMIIGFGCNVPAIYATRNIESRPVRVLTGLMIPFMSCSARLPVYVIFGLAFFPRHASWVIWGLYLIGMIIAALLGLLLTRLIFKETHSAPASVLPPYRLPNVRGLMAYAVSHSVHFIKNAATVILLVSIILWGLLHLPWDVQNHRQSLFGQVSSALAPTLAPAGFGEWQVTGALLTGMIAKEMIISSLAQLYGTETRKAGTADASIATDLRQIVIGFGVAAIQAGKGLLEALTPGVRLFPPNPTPQDTSLTRSLVGAFSPLAAFAFLVFVLTYVPCVATITAQAQQFGWKWAGLSVAIQTVLPWLLAVGIYQAGRAIGLG